ncbi:autoinducer binding domain-containing protein [Yoonia sp. BS5-3]|uniref:Autoinducer binding domain-containing protein n=1 Tax=Yoonia phaeophyticola TaxID=3137369 RepID=A0ABZ2V1I4_9RHOB
MSATQVEISEVLGGLNELAPTGYALGFHIAYTTPRFMFQTYAKAWLDYYSQNGLLMNDPMVAWGFEHVGARRWSDLDDPAGVMKLAADHGMHFGVVIATDQGDSRSICGFANAAREFTDDEINKLSADVLKLHDSTAEQAQLSPETVQQLKNMSILVTHPGS